MYNFFILVWSESFYCSMFHICCFPCLFVLPSCKFHAEWKTANHQITRKSIAVKSVIHDKKMTEHNIK